jgi:cell division protease FtsH
MTESTLDRRDLDDRRTLEFLERNRYVDLPIGWSDVIGHEHAKRELRVVAAALSRRDLAERLGVPLVKGVLITGPSGIGKTLLARAFAGSVDRPVYVLPAADLTATRIRRVYDALADTPCIVVIDEIDLIAGRHRYERRTGAAAALCVALDGVVPLTGPITIGLTSEDVDELDPSVIRSGRLTTKVVLEAPDRVDRRALWDKYTRDLPIAGSIDLEDATDRSQGMTGADIAAVARSAAGLALADGLEALDQEHLEEALDRRGTSRRPPRDDDAMRRAVAIHEAGHAVFAFAVLGAPALNAAVVARTGRAAGHVSLRSEWGEAHALDGREWRNLVALSLAGIAAEELLLGHDRVTYGSQDDLANATDYVLRAAENGLLDTFGRASFERMERGPSPDSYETRGSEAMRSTLWRAVREEIEAEADRARRELALRRAAVERLAETLQRAGSLSGARLVEALREAGAEERRDVD